MILTSTQKHLTTGSKIYFENCSVNLASSVNIYVISDTAVNNLLCKLEDTTHFNVFTISNGNITIVDQIDNSNVELIQSAGKFIYKINIIFSAQNDSQYIGKLNVQYNSINESIELVASAEELDQRLLILLQNFKQYISEDYVTAFRESVINSTEIDNQLYNRKMREMLHNIFNLTALHSSYKNLSTILSFFGYGDLLTIKEYWKSNDQYKSTDISNAVLASIDKHLIGYEKTNQMSLVYQINEQNGIDEDGLPIYVNIFDNTDNILTKLYALERVLIQDFLYINTHIVDIVGEYQTAVGLELNVVLNDIHVEDIQLSDNISSVIDYEFEYETVFIERHNVIIEPFVAEENGLDLERIPGVIIGTQTDNVFHVERIAEEFEKFDMLTQFYSGDFGLFELNLEYDSTRYQSFKYLIQDSVSGAFVFESKHKLIDELSSTLRFGIKTLGSYKLTLYLIDWYGAPTIIGIPRTITVSTRPIDIFIGKYDAEGTIDKDLNLYTTFVDTTSETDSIVVDNISETLDINTWDPTTNTPTMQIARMYESDFDQFSTYTNLNQLNSIPIAKLDGLPLTTWGHSYGIAIFDLLGDLSVKDVILKMRIYDHLPYEEVINQTWDPDNDPLSIDPIVWITNVLKIINIFCESNPDSIFNDFTWDLHWYSNNPIAQISDARPMLRAKSKLSGYNMSMLDIVQESNPHSDFEESYLVTNVKTFSRIDANLQFGFIQSAISDFVVNIDDGNFLYQQNNMNINDIDALYDQIVQCIQYVDLQNEISVDLVNNSIMIYSKYDISIKHDSIGHQYDIARGLDSSKIIKLDLGADIKLGEPFFAFIDLEKRIDLGDTTWILRNTLTNEIITTQHAWSFRWIVSSIGSYSLTLMCTDKSGDVIVTKHGCIVVT